MRARRGKEDKRWDTLLHGVGVLGDGGSALVERTNTSVAIAQVRGRKPRGEPTHLVEGEALLNLRTESLSELGRGGVW